jgi:hypothetical protein
MLNSIPGGRVMSAPLGRKKALALSVNVERNAERLSRNVFLSLHFPQDTLDHGAAALQLMFEIAVIGAGNLVNQVLVAFFQYIQQ